MAYKCPHAVIRGATDAIRCKVSGSVCAHQKWCGMMGRIVLTDGAVRCPGREQNADLGVSAAGSGAAGVDHQNDVRREEE